MLAAELGCEVAAIMDFEMTLCDTQPSQIWGLERELLSAPRLDNQMHCFTALRALLAQAASAPPSAPDVCLIALFDHEEVGSDSSTGAGGPIMMESLQRLSSCFAADEPHAAHEALQASIRRSFLMSADSAHAVHPNYAEKHQSAHAPILNKGTVIKTNDNQRYATNGESGFVVRELARRAGIKVQEFMVKNDCPCGSTIGPIISSKTVRHPRRSRRLRCPAAGDWWRRPLVACLIACGARLHPAHLQRTTAAQPCLRLTCPAPHPSLAGVTHCRSRRGLLVDALHSRDRRRRRHRQLAHPLPHFLRLLCRARQQVQVWPLDLRAD